MEHFAGLMHGHADGGLSQQEEAVKEDGLCVPVMTNYFCFCQFASKYSSDLIRTVERHPSHESFHSLGHINTCALAASSKTRPFLIWSSCDPAWTEPDVWVFVLFFKIDFFFNAVPSAV